MALIKPEPVDDYTQGTETDFPKENQASKKDDSILGPMHEKFSSGPQGISSIISIKSEPDDSSSEDWDDCEGAIKEELDEPESGNELENPLFVTVKEEANDETLLDEGTFDLGDGAQGPVADTEGLPQNASSALELLQTESFTCSPHYNSIEGQKQGLQDCFVDNRTQCQSNISLKVRSFAACDIPFYVASTSQNKKKINKGLGKKGKTQESAEMQGTDMREKKSVDKNCGRSLVRDGKVGRKTKQSFSSLGTSSKQIVQTHSSKNTYMCSHCDKIFDDEVSLALHVGIHIVEKPFKCNRCDKAFRYRGILNTHLRRRTCDKHFKCTQCEEEFRRKDKLKFHMREHIGEKPFKCTLCDEAFVRKDYLTYHMWLHTGGKPFKCNQCDEAFNKSSSLTTHMRQHTSEKVFTCNVCKKTFAHYVGLTQHMQTHTSE